MLYTALPRIGGTPHPGAGSRRGWNGPLLCSSFYWCFPLTLPKQGDRVKTCSWARLCHEEVLLSCVLYTGKGISVSLGLNPPQREWHPLSGRKGLAEEPGKEMLNPLLAPSPSAQSCPFTTCLTCAWRHFHLLGYWWRLEHCCPALAVCAPFSHYQTCFAKTCSLLSVVSLTVAKLLIPLV